MHINGEGIIFCFWNVLLVTCLPIYSAVAVFLREALVRYEYTQMTIYKLSEITCISHVKT
jgi:hypothetical protein